MKFNEMKYDERMFDVEEYKSIKLHQGISEGQEVWSGIAGQYLTAPEEKGIYSLYEVATLTDGRWVHCYFEFIMEEPDPDFRKNRYIPEVEDDEGWEWDEVRDFI